MNDMAQKWRIDSHEESLVWLIGDGPKVQDWHLLHSAFRVFIAGLGLCLFGYAIHLATYRATAAEARTAPARPVATARIEAPFAPTALRPLAAVDAQAWNASVPVSVNRTPSAAAFLEPVSQGTDTQRALDCLTMAIYYEAGNEPLDGERAVAQVVLNRVRHIAFPKTVCGVVFDGAERTTGCQFTFACDGALARIPLPSSWARARTVASAALAGYVYAPVGLATHYHANYVVPYWASSLEKIATVATHIFYRWSGSEGRKGAFATRYAGNEPSPSYLIAHAATVQVPGASTVSIGMPVVPTGPATPVIAAERPILIAPGALPAVGATSPSVDDPRPETKVALGERWILSHPAQEEPSDPIPASRPVLIASEKGTVSH